MMEKGNNSNLFSIQTGMMGKSWKDGFFCLRGVLEVIQPNIQPGLILTPTISTLTNEAISSDSFQSLPDPQEKGSPDWM